MIWTLTGPAATPDLTPPTLGSRGPLRVGSDPQSVIEFGFSGSFLFAQPLFAQPLSSSCPELAVLANPDPAFEKCDFQMPFISMADAVEMSAHPCAEIVAVQNGPIQDSNYLAAHVAASVMFGPVCPSVSVITTDTAA